MTAGGFRPLAGSKASELGLTLIFALTIRCFRPLSGSKVSEQPIMKTTYYSKPFPSPHGD